MIVSTKGRYALRVMIDMAQHQQDGFVPLKDIAQREDISEKYLESIIKVLVKEKMLTGVRGKGGGYRLNRLPEEYTVWSIISLTETSLTPVSCMETEECSRKGNCTTLPMWNEFAHVMKDFFEKYTLRDLMREEQV